MGILWVVRFKLVSTTKLVHRFRIISTKCSAFSRIVDFIPPGCLYLIIPEGFNSSLRILTKTLSRGIVNLLGERTSFRFSRGSDKYAMVNMDATQGVIFTENTLDFDFQLGVNKSYPIERGKMLPGEYFTPINSYQGSGSLYYNPVAISNLGKDDRVSNNLQNTFRLRYSVTDWLTLRETVSFQYTGEKSQNFMPYNALGTDWLAWTVNKAEEGNSINSSISNPICNIITTIS